MTIYYPQSHECPNQTPKSSEPLCVNAGAFVCLGAGNSSGGNSIGDYRAEANPDVPVLALFG